MFCVELLDLPVSEPIYQRCPIEVGRGLVINGYTGGGDDVGLLGIPGIAEAIGVDRSSLLRAIAKPDGIVYKQLVGLGFSGEVLTILARVGRAVKPVKAVKVSDFTAFLAYADLIAGKPRAKGLAKALGEIGLRSVGSIEMTKDEMVALIDQRVSEAMEEAGGLH